MTKKELDTAFRRVNKLVAERGHTMSDEQLDKALNIWDVLVKAQCDHIPERSDHLKKSDDSRPVLRAVSGGSPVVVRPGLSFGRRATPYNDPRTGSQLTGHQMAAIRAGLNPDTPGIERMTYPEMCDLAQGRIKQSVVPFQRAAGLHRNTD